MELLQGYVEDDGKVGIDDLHRWHNTSVINFLSDIESASGIDKLSKVRLYRSESSRCHNNFMEHALLQLPWSPAALKGMLSLCNMWASLGIRYPIKETTF